MNVLLTGGTGFVGQGLVERLAAQYHLVCAGCQPPQTKTQLDFAALDLSAAPEDLERACSQIFANHQIDVICHSAARAHIMHDTVADPLAEFRRINTTATLLLANAAARNGVKRFVYLSSIKVNGEGREGQPYTAADPADPSDPYAVSKYEAELGLHEVSIKTGMEVVIIRPPLVYGPGVKANFKRLINWINKGIPLPLKGIRNKRSMVGRSNLVDLIETCLTHPEAKGKTFLVSDDDDLSTAQLITKIASALNVKPRLIWVPTSFLNLAGKLTQRKDQVERLCGSLQVDITDTKQTLDWTPKYSVNEELARTTQHFKSHLNH